MVTKSKAILRQKSVTTPQSEVNFLRGKFDKEIKLRSGKLQGLAACQLCKNYRMFVVRDPKTKKFEYVVNPKVLFKFGIIFKFEGCLSEDGLYFVGRPIFSIVRYTTIDGETVTKFLGRKRTRIFMHEYDHINGISLSDKKVSIRI